MGAVLEALSEYIDFLVLGAVALAALCAPFGPGLLTKGWTRLNAGEKDDPGAPEKDSSIISIRGGLIAGAMFALLYFSGYFLTAIGATFVYPAHVGIIDTVATFDPNNKSSDAGIKPVVFERVIPVFGPLLRPKQSELKNYWRDATRQIFWQVCDEKSADGMLAGGILKELRLLRGVIGLTQILLPLCLLVALWNLRAARRSKRPLAWSTVAWPLGTFGTALVVYALLIIPSYTLVEYDNHVTVWAAFPGDLDKADLDKDAGKIDVDHMDNLLPCRKMKILAEQGKSKEGTAGNGSSLPSNALKNH